MALLPLAALVSAGWAVGGLVGLAALAWRRGTPPVAAPPAGPAWRGVLYVFGAGMSPLAKESAREHPFIYAAGVTYHLGIFGAVGTLALAIAGSTMPDSIRVPATALMAVAAIAGVSLAGRRMASPLLRAISAPDDYAANLLVDGWLLTAAAWWWLQPAGTPAFLIASIILGVYAPLGKIRHCIFFFLSRGLLGARLGRRGIVGSARALELRR